MPYPAEVGTTTRIVLTLAVGTVGGCLFSLLGFPAPWMSGAMVLVAAAALGRMPVGFSNAFRTVLFVALGMSSGSGVTPDVVEKIGLWPWTMAALAVLVVLVTGSTYIYLRFLAKWEPETAYFGSIPGALAFVLAVAAERQADLSRIATSQSIRLLVLVAILPLVVTSSAPEVLDISSKATEAPSFLQGMLLVGVCTAAGFLATKAHVPGGWLMGAFFASAFLNMNAIVPVSFPDWILIPFYICLGCFIGTRFQAVTAAIFARLAAASLGAVAIGISISSLIALAMSWALDLPFGPTLLAYAPGGLEVMTLLAFMLNFDPAFVAAHQLTRYIGMAFFLPLVTRILFGPPDVKRSQAQKQH